MDYIQIERSEGELRMTFIKNELVFNMTSFMLEFILKTLHADSADSAGRIVLDLSNVYHIDSSAVGMFISLKNAMRRSGKELYLVGVKENVLQILKFLDITGFLNLSAA